MVSAKPKKSAEKQDQGLSDHKVKLPHADLSASRSWQPLEPKSPAEEDLASILQAGIKDQSAEEIDDLYSARHPGVAESSSQSPGDQQPDFQPASNDDLAALAETVYDTSFYLVPRMKEHYLLGELAQELRTWMPELSQIYGWELDLISIRPDYFKWTLLDFPECLTLKTLAAVRQWTSKRIFEAFPALQTDENIGDFWSPGYLVDTQSHDFPTQVLIAHVSRDWSERSSGHRRQ
ncbi:MAG: hypothetical protein BWX85_00392 [Chloroflexi bacterium ADurb.Bin120]|uniref:Transposase IS200-like domain-containing protein n=1 Tax=Candidatus Brevifilum fermentans TaxID=1986204 RepID=A0A1Y6K365_9CHLR|nr:MAG: hypothetical protein BWX85_00392 [Chloroflexi bacterium ADurb.Bin120]SMX53298.1 protein of unknown function [Brevefilum fermentans]